MPIFDTPEPIAVTIEIGVGDVRLVAGERANTVVEVFPSDATKRDDVLAAQQTRVEYADGRLLVKAPRSWRRYSPFSDGGAIDVHIDVPAGSRLTGEAALAALQGTGRLGDCRYKTALGDIRLDQAGAVQLRTGVGDIAVGRARNDAEVTAGSGAVDIGVIDGDAVIKSSNGETRVGEVNGDVRVQAANGSVTIERADAAITVKTANGDVRLAAIRRGSVVAETACGDLEIGICDGTTAWLDLHTHYGHVLNNLEVAEPGEPDDETVEVRARTATGDITIRRQSAPAPSKGEA